MSYFIFQKNSENLPGTLVKIAENQSDLNNLTINLSNCTVVEDSQQNFDLVKLGTKFVISYSGNTITYGDVVITPFSKDSLKNYIAIYNNEIKQFLNNWPNSPLFTRWNNYYNQMSNLDLNSITYPLNETLEQYFQSNGQPAYVSLQIP